MFVQLFILQYTLALYVCFKQVSTVQIKLNINVESLYKNQGGRRQCNVNETGTQSFLTLLSLLLTQIIVDN